MANSRDKNQILDENNDKQPLPINATKSTYQTIEAENKPDTHVSLRKFFSGMISSLPYLNRNQHTDTTITANSNSSSKLHNILLPSFIETSVAMSYSAVAYHFLTSKVAWYLNPFVTSSTLMGFNLFQRLLSTSLSDDNKVDKAGKKMLRVSRGLVYSLMDTGTRSIVVHESGHALAALSFFQNANPRIHITPGKGGFTSYHLDALTELGKKIGKTHSRTVITAAGTGVATLWDCMSLIAAQTISDEYPEIKSHLRLAVLVNVLNELAYVFSVYYSGCDNIGHDFCKLDQAGFSPSEAAAAILVPLIVLQGILSGISYMRHSKNMKDNKETRIEEINEEVNKERDIEANTNEETRVFRPRC